MLTGQEMFRSKSSYTVQSVEKALDILELLADELSDATLPHIAEKLGISRNKAFRLLATLESRGLVQREEHSGIYRVGLDTVGLAQRFIRGANLIKHAHPVMEELARKHEEAVYLTVLLGEEVLFLDVVDGAQTVKTAPLVGKKFPCLTNAPGKVIKALESSDLLEKVFKKGRRMAQDDMAKLETELGEIRRKRVAVGHDCLGEGIIDVAVAIKDYAGKVVGAITLMGPAFRLFAERIENEIVPSLLEGADMLSLKFGYAKF
ncbi:MAG: helix-turn-helix transcriptional regulator, IclR family [Deltaproteobacteria bacterium]|nr:helix-turn-helix transcriptional regulator, IclR family [Deltaproteobacteria bacterium]